MPHLLDLILTWLHLQSFFKCPASLFKLTKVLNIDKFILHYFLKLENFRICSGKIMKKSYNWKWKVEGRDSIEWRILKRITLILILIWYWILFELILSLVVQRPGQVGRKALAGVLSLWFCLLGSYVGRMQHSWVPEPWLALQQHSPAWYSPACCASLFLRFPCGRMLHGTCHLAAAPLLCSIQHMYILQWCVRSN